eukprot:COSAG06_NODE_21757_length_746_cov_1.227202_1_plen_33_part_01
MERGSNSIRKGQSNSALHYGTKLYSNAVLCCAV